MGEGTRPLVANSDEWRTAALERTAKVASAFVVGVGLLVLAGWATGSRQLTTIVPGLPNMKANTAIGLILLGTAMLARGKLRLVLASVPMLIGLLTAIEYTAGADLGIDQLLFTEVGTTVTAPGRMSPIAATCFILTGVAVIALALDAVRMAHATAILAWVFAFIALVGYLLGAQALYTVSMYSSMSLHTSVSFLLVSTAVLSTRAKDGLTRAFASSGAGAIMLRRVLPIAIVAPLVVAYLERAGTRGGVFDQAFGKSLSVTAIVLILASLIWWAASRMFRLDRARADATMRLQRLNTELEEKVDERTADLAASEERYRATSESATDGIISADQDNNIVYANPAAEALLGYKPNELEGMKLVDLMPERFHSAHRAGFARYLQTRDPRLIGKGAVEVVAKRKDGSEVPIELALASWAAEGNTYFTGVMRDVTERHQTAERLQESARFFRAITENVSDLILQTSADGQITYASPAAQRMLSYEPDDLIGRQPADLVTSDGVDEIRRVVATAVEGSPASTQVQIRCQDGSAVWVQAAASPVNDPASPDEAGIIWVIRDISEHVAELERERELARRERDLNQLKNEFVGIVAHDLKSPMTVIGGFADILVQHWETTGDDEKLSFLGRIRDNVQRLSTLIDDVLQVARIESGEMLYNIEPVDLRAIIDATVTELRAAYPDHECRVNVPDDLPLVLADEDRQWRILTNLLSNAMKFSDPGDKVEVCAQREGNYVAVHVSDEGHGMRPEDLSKLFQPFARVDQPEGRRVKGTGLGLYISKSLVEGQGGTIGVESTLGEGTTFTYTVPVAEEGT